MFVVSVSLLDDVVAFCSFSSVVLESGVALPLAADSMPAMPAQTYSSKSNIGFEKGLFATPRNTLLDVGLHVSSRVTIDSLAVVLHAYALNSVLAACSERCDKLRLTDTLKVVV